MTLRTTLMTPKLGFAAFGVALLLALGWVATKSGPLAPTRVTLAPVIRGEVDDSPH